MMKSAIAAALVVGGASAAQAKTYNYTFGTASGGSYCDGISFSVSSGVAVGEHTGSGSGCTEGSYAGGLQVKVSGASAKTFLMATDEPTFPGSIEDFLVDTKGGTWLLYLEDTAYSIPFELINEGVLIKGHPIHSPKAKSMPAAMGGKGASLLHK